MYSAEEKKKLVQLFWEGFEIYSSNSILVNNRKKKWMLHRTKVPHIHLKFDPCRTDVKVVLEINHRSSDDRVEKYEQLFTYKSILESKFENGLIWDATYTRESGQDVCWIYTKLNGVDINKRNDWMKMYQFMETNMYRLEKNFDIIKDIITD